MTTRNMILVDFKSFLNVPVFVNCPKFQNQGFQLY